MKRIEYDKRLLFYHSVVLKPNAAPSNRIYYDLRQFGICHFNCFYVGHLSFFVYNKSDYAGSVVLLAEFIFMFI